MKTLLATVLLLTSLSAFSMRVPLPTCEDNKVMYEDPNHFYADFCINGLGVTSPSECVKYQRQSDPALLDKEIIKFLKARAIKVCGQ